MTTRSHRRRASAVTGFTMIEILLALALTGFTMVALNTFVFSMGELWGRNTDQRLFDLHVRSVTRYLETELRNAALPPAGRATPTAIAPQEIRARNGTENLLTFELPEGSRLLVWPDRPLPEVVCSLAVRDRVGLVLLWHSRLEKKFADDPPREVIVSAFVSGLGYDYYDVDFKRWRTEPQLRKDAQGALETPQRLRLTFTYGTRSQESLITLPSAPEGLPAF